jgi:hypothetical protein
MTTPPRPDQDIGPPPAVLAAGGAAGVFRGRLVIVIGGGPPGTGIFIYSSTGALLGSWTGDAGTDPIDHQAVPQGLLSQDPSATIQAVLSAGSLTLEKLSGALAPPLISLADDTSVTTDGTSIRSSGIVTPVVGAVVPGNTAGLAETWHTLGTAAQYSITRARYRMDAFGCLELDIQVTSSGTVGQDTAFSVTLPAAYRPPVQRDMPLVQTVVQNSGSNWPRLYVTAAGGVHLFVRSNTASDFGTHCSIPLD